jgi:hypothetical protein
MKTYIGDSVYLEVQADGYWLTTENGLPTDPSNKIFLEWRVHKSLIEVLAAIFAEHERHSKKE